MSKIPLQGNGMAAIPKRWWVGTAILCHEGHAAEACSYVTNSSFCTPNNLHRAGQRVRP